MDDPQVFFAVCVRLHFDTDHLKRLAAWVITEVDEPWVGHRGASWRRLDVHQCLAPRIFNR